MDSCWRIFVLVLVAARSSAANTEQLRGFRAHDFAKFAGAMQPTVAASTLSRVETEWRSQALQFVECKADATRSDCGLMQSAFQKSCSTIVNAVVAASSGDRETVAEYMAVVCNEPQLNDWKHERCQNFAKAISNTLTADSYQNRVKLNAGGLCVGFWASMSNAEGSRVAQEHALQAKHIEEERAKAAKRAKDAAEALAEATAARNRKMAAEAKHREIEEKRRAVEEQHRRQVAEKAVREAKLVAEREAAAKAAAARRAAEKAALEAKMRQRNEAAQKAAEAQAAEADAKLAQAKHDEQETKRNIADAEAETAKRALHQPQPVAKAAKVAQSAKDIAAAAPRPEKSQESHAAVTGKKIINHKQ